MPCCAGWVNFYNAVKTTAGHHGARLYRFKKLFERRLAPRPWLPAKRLFLPRLFCNKESQYNDKRERLCNRDTHRLHGIRTACRYNMQ